MTRASRYFWILPQKKSWFAQVEIPLMTWVYPVLGMMEEVPSAIKDAQARWSIAGWMRLQTSERWWKSLQSLAFPPFKGFNISLEAVSFCLQFTWQHAAAYQLVPWKEDVKKALKASGGDVLCLWHPGWPFPPYILDNRLVWQVLFKINFKLIPVVTLHIWSSSRLCLLNCQTSFICLTHETGSTSKR